MPDASEEQPTTTTTKESTEELLVRKDREFTEWIEQAPDFMIVKYAREFIEVRMEQKPDSRLRGMDAALCKRLQVLQDRLMTTP